MTLHRLMLMRENYFKVCVYSGVMTAPVNDGTLDIKGKVCVDIHEGSGVCMDSYRCWKVGKTSCSDKTN